MIRRTPLKRSQRPIPRPGKPNAKRKALRKGRVVDREYLDWCATQPCCVTLELPATTHHIRAFGSPKDDHSVIRLVARLHLHEAGMNSIERLGKEKFEAMHGISLMDEASKLYE